MCGDVFDPLAVDIDLAAVAQRSKNSAPVKGRFLPARISSGHCDISYSIH